MCVELGVETDGFLMVLRIDEDGPSAIVRPEQQPDTIFTAAPEVIIGLAVGGLTIDQALSMGDLRGDRRVLCEVFPPGRAIAAAGFLPSSTDD